MTPHELMRALICLVLLLPFAALVAHADPPPPELGVTVTRATDCASGCWRLVSLDYEDPDASQGRHHIYGRLIQGGAAPGGLPWHVAWPDGDVRLETKPAPEVADFAMFGCYFPEHGSGPYLAYAGDDPERSDIVRGMGLPSCYHVSFWPVWEWQDEPREPLPPRLYIPIAGLP